MILTSLRRLRLYATGDSDTPVPDTPKNNKQFQMWLPAVSSDIERYIRRTIALDYYTEYLDIRNLNEYYISSAPIIGLVDAYEDPLSLWIGQERQIQYATIGMTGNSVVNPFIFNYVRERALRIRYFGGLARHAVNSRYMITTSGTFTAGQMVIGNTSGACGYVVTTDSNSITIEVYYGLFLSGETVQVYADEDKTTPGVTCIISNYPEYGLIYYTGMEQYQVGYYVKGKTSGNVAQIVSLGGTPIATAVLTNNGIINNEAVDVCTDLACQNVLFTNVFKLVENRSLADAFPEIVTGCEMQIRYAKKHQTDFENMSSGKDGTSRRRGENDDSLLLPEVKNILSRYRTYYEW